MNDSQWIEELKAACDALNAQGPIVLELDAVLAIRLIATVQLASRHPGARVSPSIQSACTTMRLLCHAIAGREERLGRSLERGWHSAFDVPPTDS